MKFGKNPLKPSDFMQFLIFRVIDVIQIEHSCIDTD